MKPNNLEIVTDRPQLFRTDRLTISDN